MEKGLTLIRLTPCYIGSPARTRTTDPMVNSHLLYRLSYWGMNPFYRQLVQVVSSATGTPVFSLMYFNWSTGAK